MRIYYISPSEIPSRAANSVHVLFQTKAFSEFGYEITLFCRRTVFNENDLEASIKEDYGIDLKSINIVSFFSRFNRATNVRICLSFIYYYFSHKSPNVILSRNLYAAFFLAVILRRRIFFETHQLEFGLKRLMQRMIVLNSKTTTILISKQLLHFLSNHLQLSEFDHLILHDAAEDRSMKITDKKKQAYQQSIPVNHEDWDCICGYFGAIHPGRGVEIIEEMANKRDGTLFLVYGGTAEECKKRNATLTLSNLIHYPHIPYHEAREKMLDMDILLMPYQKKLSVGVDGKGSNTSDWMSPMKMFDYLSSGVPIISSDLPSLREVLIDEKNSLLVNPTDVNGWLEALERLIYNKDLSKRIAKRAYIDFKEKHTWNIRATKIIEKTKELQLDKS